MRSERAIQLGDSCDVILVVLRHKLLSLLVLVESELDLLEDLTMDELIDVIVGGPFVHLGNLVHAFKKMEVARFLRACLQEDIRNHIV